MIIFKIEHQSELVTARNHNKIMNVNYRELMNRHKQTGLQSRFRRGPKTRPGGEFGFSKRSLKYQRRKQKIKGTLAPNVWSGKTRENAKNATVRATAKRGTIKFPTGYRLTYQRRQELEGISRMEQYKYAKTMKRRYIEMANSRQFKRKRRKKVT